MRRLLMTRNASKHLWTAASRFMGSAPLLIGNETNVRDGDTFKVVLSDFIGSFGEGQRTRASAGDMLHFLDLWGGYTGKCFIFGDENHFHRTTERNHGLTVATVSFNSFVLHRPVLRGDFLVVTGTAVDAGRSSVGVHLDVSQQGYDSQSCVHVGECYITLVCVSSKELYRTVKDIVPGLRINSELGKARHVVYRNIRELQRVEVTGKEEENGVSILKPETLDDFVNMHKPRKVSIGDTVTSAVRIFFPADLNNNNAVYGGVLLRWMEGHAQHCARMFAESPHVNTIGMYGMTFDCPIFPTDVATLKAKVVFVRHTTLEVAVEIDLERSGKIVRSNRAFFVLACMDGESNRVTVPKGIDLQNSAPVHLIDYAIAKKRYEYSLRYKLEPLCSEVPSCTQECTPII